SHERHGPMTTPVHGASISRRGVLAVAVGSALAAIPGCKKSPAESTQSSATQPSPSVPTLTKVKVAAMVAVAVGQVVIQIPHPAATIIGATLELTGSLTLAYVTYAEAKEQQLQVQLSREDAETLRKRPVMKVIREDGSSFDQEVKVVPSL